MQEQAKRRGQPGSGAAAIRKPVALALQGGGAHGAFTWGVLDRLLEDGRLDIEAVSATSAGAMNAAVMASGIAIGGVEGGRAALARFWEAVSQAGQMWSPTRAFPWWAWLEPGGISGDLNPAFLAFQALTQIASPYQLNPLNLNPLRDILAEAVDFEALRRDGNAIRLYLSATNVRSGKVKIFENGALSADAVLASACLPNVFQAIEIEGEAYWDGGFMGNPAIFPLIYRAGTRDIVIVHINPLERAKLPTTAPEILDRMNEISFNSSLMREMRAIAFVTRLIDEGALDGKRYAKLRIHDVRDDETFSALGVASKLDPEWGFLCRLRDRGRERAGEWLDANFATIGVESSVDVAAVYL